MLFDVVLTIDVLLFVVFLRVQSLACLLLRPFQGEKVPPRYCVVASALSGGITSPLFDMRLGFSIHQESLLVFMQNAVHFWADIFIPRLSRYSSVVRSSFLASDVSVIGMTRGTCS